MTLICQLRALVSQHAGSKTNSIHPKLWITNVSNDSHDETIVVKDEKDDAAMEGCVEGLKEFDDYFELVSEEAMKKEMMDEIFGSCKASLSKPPLVMKPSSQN